MTDATVPRPGAGPVPAPQPAFFEEPTLDRLLAVTLELGAELWVQRERMRVVERLLGEKGVVTSAMIEQYQPDEAEIAESRAQRDAFVRRVFGAFARDGVPATPDAP
jgi:hypothetical protein